MNLQSDYIYLLFPLVFLIHNLEEGIWLPQWTRQTKPFHREVGTKAFRFALAIVSILGVGITFLYVLCPTNTFLTYSYFGFLGTMCVNVIFPHLAATLFYRKYAPGLLTGLILLPVCLWLIGLGIVQERITTKAAVLSSIILTVLQTALLPLLLHLGKQWEKR